MVHNISYFFVNGVELFSGNFVVRTFAETEEHVFHLFFSISLFKSRFLETYLVHHFRKLFYVQSSVLVGVIFVKYLV